MTKRSLPLVLALGLGSVACGGPAVYHPQGVREFVSMDAQVEVSPNEGAYQVDVELENLVPPGRVQTGLSTYVMWFVPNGGAPTRAALVNYDEGARKGHALATFPDRAFGILVTAEQGPTPVQPSEHRVFQQRVEYH